MEGRQPMNMRGHFRRGISTLLAAALTLGTAAGAAPAAQALRDSVTCHPVQLGARVLPAQAAGNDTFLAAYVRKEQQGSYNSNDLFKKTKSKNLRKSTDALSRTTKYWHNSNDDWYTEFTWTFDPDSQVKQLWNAGGLALGFSGSLYSDYHRNLGRHTSELWDRVQVKISGLNGESEKVLLDKASKGEKDQQAQPYAATVRPGGNQHTAVKLRAGAYDCNCGSSGLGDAVVYLVDETAPTVTQVYAASDAAGSSRLTGDSGLPAGEKVYFILEFSENIRFADNQPAPLELALSCAWKDSDQDVTSPVTADLVSLTGSKLVFEMTVPQELDGEPTDIYVNAIAPTQSWANQSGFSWTLLDETGAPFAVQAGMLDPISSRITDLAGNPLNWTDSKKDLSERAYLDTVSPELKQVTISGRRIKQASTTQKTQDGGWPADTDLSAVYAATGDQLTFGVWYSEQITGLDLNNVVATLNLQDGSSPVTLQAAQLLNVTGKSAFGVDAGSGYVSQLVFQPLTLTETMTWEADAPLRIVSISGMDDATDVAGNALTQPATIPAPLQQQYPDVTAPVVSTTMNKTEDQTKYIPLADNSFSYNFTVPVKVTDVGSGCAGLEGSFSLDLTSAQDYSWYVDATPTVDQKRFSGRMSYGPRQNKFTVLGPNETIYIHIRTLQGASYYTDGYFEESITINVKDYAGNTTTQTYPLRHKADTYAPKVEPRGYTPTVASVAGTDYAVTMQAKIKVEDSFGLKSIHYYWDEDTTNQQSVDITGNTVEFTAEWSGNVSLGEGATQLSGTKTLHVLADDKAGNTTTWEKGYSYEVGRGKSSYTIYTGSPEKPEFEPIVFMQHPNDITQSGTTGSTRVDSIVLFEYEEGLYYACMPYYNEASPTNGEIKILDGLFNGTASATDDKWFWVNGKGIYKLDADNDTASLKWETKADVSTVKNFLTNHYGPLNVYFLASPELVVTQADRTEAAATLTVSQDKGTIDKEVIYLAAGFDPTRDYTVEITDAVDAAGKSVKEKLTNPTAETGVVSDLSEVGFKLKLTNTKDSTAADAVKFGLNLIDFSTDLTTLSTKSYYDVEHSMTKNGAYSSVADNRGLDAAEEQVLTVPDRAMEQGGRGWYRFKFHFLLRDGTTEWTVYSDPFYVDTLQSSLYLSGCDKTYTKEDGTAVPVVSKTYTETAQPAQLEIGLAEVPEGWTTTQQLTFTGKFGQSQDPSQQTDIGALADALRLRAYSRKDEKGAEHAPWVTLSPREGYTDYYTASLTPVLAEEITAGSYGSGGLLPLTEGENLVCVQIMNPNGTLTEKELLVRVSVKAPDPIAWQETGKTASQTTLKPALTQQQKLEDWTVGLAGKQFSDERDTPAPASAYTFTAVASRAVEFYVYNEYGNLSLSSAEVTGVDAVAPNIWVSNNYSASYDNTYYDVGMYNVTLDVSDDSVSLQDMPTVTMSYDAADSARILGRALANENERVTVEVPINLERDENGAFRDYVGFDPANRGIFRTSISEFNEQEKSFDLKIWGVFPFDQEMGQGNDQNTGEPIAATRTLTFAVTDKNGNTATGDTGTVKAANRKPEFFVRGLSEDGLLNAASALPVAAVHSYGAGDITSDFSQAESYAPVFATTLPMISRDGTYTLEYTDLFGNTGTTELNVSNVFSSSVVDVELSETNYTNQPVTVTARVKTETGTITAMTADENGKTIYGTLGQPDADKRVLSASLDLENNATVTVKTKDSPDAEEDTFTLKVGNIDKTLAPATVFFEYDGMAQPEYVAGTTDTVAGEVTAVLSCEEFVTGANGPLSYTFEAGSAKGATHTFEYMDRAGNTGTLTATLPVNIQGKQPGETVVDTAAPNYTANLYGMRNNQYAFQGDAIYRPGEGDDPAALRQEAVTAMNAVLNAYPAQSYRIIFDVEDDSDVKLLLRPANAAPPTSYSDTGASVTGVTVTGHTVTVTEKTSFDLYLVDAGSHVTPIRGVSFTALDNTPPTVTVRNETISDEENGTFIRSYFEVEPGEEIFVTDDRVVVEVTMVKVGEDEYQNPIYKKVTTYYYDHQKNGSFQFRYTDIYGNIGAVTATASGIDNVKPILNSTLWFGTTDNKAPGAQGERKVNHDVTAVLTVSKSIREVELSPADANVSVTWVGQKATVTYAQNASAIQAKITAANGRSVTASLPAVECIDKDPPTVTPGAVTTASNNKSKTYSFATNEATTLTEGGTSSHTSLATDHTWTATQNGTVELQFADEAGNVTKKKVEVTGLDTEKLTLLFNTAGSDDGAKSEDEISELNLTTGSALYVKTSKAATLKLGAGEEEPTSVSANTWTSFTLPSAGGFCVLKATDTSTQEATYVTLLVTQADATPPVISFSGNTVTVAADTSADEVKQRARAGVSVTDNVDRAVDFTVTGLPDPVAKGIYTLTYTATDKANNTATATRTLYVTAKGAPALTLNGQIVQPFGTVIIRGSTLEVQVPMTQPVMVKLKKGIKTSGQMKYGATILKVDADGKATAGLDRGYYTVYIRTQNRQEVIAYVYRDA